MTTINDVALALAQTWDTRLASLTIDVNLYVGEMPPAGTLQSDGATAVPELCASVEQVAAPPSNRMMRAGSSAGEMHRDVLCVVRVRGAVHAPKAAWDLAVDMIEAMQNNPPSGYFQVQCSGTPFKLGPTENPNDAPGYTFEAFASYAET